jgi:hypothetical protein
VVLGTGGPGQWGRQRRQEHRAAAPLQLPLPDSLRTGKITGNSENPALVSGAVSAAFLLNSRKLNVVHFLDCLFQVVHFRRPILGIHFIKTT